MPTSKLVGLVFDTWGDADRVMEGLTPDEAGANFREGSSFAWTAGHIANTLDFWVNVRFGGHDAHPLIGQDRFRYGGDGKAEEWEAIRRGADEVRTRARALITDMSDEDIEITTPYEGRFEGLQGKGISIRYYLSRVVAHHYFHIGEIASKRDMMGHSVGDYPGQLRETL